MMQEANSELTVKNKQLKLRLRAMEEQACLQDSMPYFMNMHNACETLPFLICLLYL